MTVVTELNASQIKTVLARLPRDEKEMLLRLPAREAARIIEVHHYFERVEHNLESGVASVVEGEAATTSAPATRPHSESPVSPSYELPYRANEHPTSAHEGAAKTVAREGKKHLVTPGSHRHKLLRCFDEKGRMTLIEAGHYAFESHGVGAGTIIGWDEGRRRASELAEFGLLANVHESLYAINVHGRAALELCDKRTRWDADTHDWGQPEELF